MNKSRDQVSTVRMRLNQIQQEFSRGRKHKGNGYSSRLRNLAMEAVASGIPRSKVARAAGVSEQSVINWGKRSSELTEPPRELALVENRGGWPEVSSLTAGPTISIEFRSGIRMAVSAAALTTELISLLNEVGR